ncbi:MAG: hypothetical protein NC120_09610 [Ruminococcus sp.]|nr:hypothetical protein [Ruminococcus sp.]
MPDKLKYPVLLIHGMGFRDDKSIGYWGRIPQAMESRGARIFYSGQDSNGSIESNARQIEVSFNRVLESTGAEKLNLIAHSKGGLEARYLISALGHADRTASLTTVSTPHNGSVTVDKLINISRPLVKFGCKAADIYFRILGDECPDTYSAVTSFETANAERFNMKYPDAGGVYYQSCGFVMKKPTSDMLMWFPWLVVNHFEGENDGLLPPRAVKWTNFKCIYTGSGGRGISHCDEVDLRRRRLSGKDGGGISDITEFYGSIIDGLKERGF